MKCAIDFIGVCGPGMANWKEAQEILRNTKTFEYVELPSLKPQVLPPNERRRATRLIKIALQVACEVSEQSGLDANGVPSVFASSLGDIEITDRICRALATDEKLVSPTQFAIPKVSFCSLDQRIPNYHSICNICVVRFLSLTRRRLYLNSAKW